MNVAEISRSWSLLNGFVCEDRADNSEFWLPIDARPFDVCGLEELYANGTSVLSSMIEEGCDALLLIHSGSHYRIPRANSLIRINYDLTGFHRDVALFHELMHAWHGYPLDDMDQDEAAQRNMLRTEWLARKARRDSLLLRHGVERFRLPCNVYDRVSYDAFDGKNPLHRESLKVKMD